jgi:hypothetical protein
VRARGAFVRSLVPSKALIPRCVAPSFQISSTHLARPAPRVSSSTAASTSDRRSTR